MRASLQHPNCVQAVMPMLPRMVTMFFQHCLCNGGQFNSRIPARFMSPPLCRYFYFVEGHRQAETSVVTSALHFLNQAATYFEAAYDRRPPIEVLQAYFASARTPCSNPLNNAPRVTFDWGAGLSSSGTSYDHSVCSSSSRPLRELFRQYGVEIVTQAVLSLFLIISELGVYCTELLIAKGAVHRLILLQSLCSRFLHEQSCHQQPDASLTTSRELLSRFLRQVGHRLQTPKGTANQLPLPMKDQVKVLGESNFSFGQGLQVLGIKVGSVMRHLCGDTRLSARDSRSRFAAVSSVLCACLAGSSVSGDMACCNSDKESFARQLFDHVCELVHTLSSCSALLRASLNAVGSCMVFHCLQANIATVRTALVLFRALKVVRAMVDLQLGHKHARDAAGDPNESAVIGQRKRWRDLLEKLQHEVLSVITGITALSDNWVRSRVCAASRLWNRACSLLTLLCAFIARACSLLSIL